MDTKRHLVIQSLIALAACLLLAVVLIRQHKAEQTRWSIFTAGDPNAGQRLFFEKKDCAHCHAVNGLGGRLAPDLGAAQTRQFDLSQLVASMWNHAPQMWKRVDASRARYPDLTNEEVAHLFAFLYTSQFADQKGDPERGRTLFTAKGCVHCHTAGGSGGRIGPDLSRSNNINTSVKWAQAMWNHAPAMQKSMAQVQIAWPRFDGGDMNDLLAFIWSGASSSERSEPELLAASPERGWQVLRSNGCLTCHSVEGRGGTSAPELGARKQMPLTVVQFAGLMWNHAPEMGAHPDAVGPAARRPFEGQQIADIVAFLSGLRYVEPTGSPYMGKTVFAERGCAACHGPAAEGGPDGPRLRGRGNPFTSIGLASAFWRHGAKLYTASPNSAKAWAVLTGRDIGELVAYLNEPPGGGS